MAPTNNRLLRATQYSEGGERSVWAERTERHVRVYFADTVVADSDSVLVVFHGRRFPTYYFPRSDIRTDLIEDSDRREVDDRLGQRAYASFVVGSRRAVDAIVSYPNPISDGPDLSGYVSFDWEAMDAWFEEDEEILRHPRDPYKRVDALHSSRHVRVIVFDTVVADTHRPVLLFETGLPVRYYIPKLDVRLDLLTPTTTRSRCPYKGEAIYWSVGVDGHYAEDIVWSYPAPIPAVAKIENLLSFYNEKVDIEVDDVLLKR